MKACGRESIDCRWVKSRQKSITGTPWGDLLSSQSNRLRFRLFTNLLISFSSGLSFTSLRSAESNRSSFVIRYRSDYRVVNCVCFMRYRFVAIDSDLTLVNPFLTVPKVFRIIWDVLWRTVFFQLHCFLSCCRSSDSSIILNRKSYRNAQGRILPGAKKNRTDFM